jgi:tetratricopeptide (TPR) repeat protein
MTAKRESQIIIVGTIVGLGIIVSGYFWFQNYLFPPGMKESIKAFEKKLNEPDPFDDHYDRSMFYFERGDYNLALKEGKQALEIAEEVFRVKGGTMNAIDVGMAHSLLLKIYLAVGDILNAEKELELEENEIRKSGIGNQRINFESTETYNDRLQSYRRRLEELKKFQQKAENGK